MKTKVKTSTSVFFPSRRKPRHLWRGRGNM